MTSSSGRQRTLAAELTAAGVPATADPRSATPPIVLVPPPRRRNDLACRGYTAEWELIPIVPGPGNADADAALSTMVDRLEDLLPVTDSEPTSYVLAPDNPPFPAYRVRFTEGIDRP
jgi:hypothetical protein